MNSIESKKHQDLFLKLEAIYNRSQNAYKPKNCFSIVFGEFGKELITDPILLKVGPIINAQEPDLNTPALEARKPLLQDIYRIIDLVYQNEQKIGEPLSHIIELINFIINEFLSDKTDVYINSFIAGFVEIIIPEIKNCYKYFTNIDLEKLKTLNSQILDKLIQYQHIRNDYKRNKLSSLAYSYSYIISIAHLYNHSSQSEVINILAKHKYQKESEYINSNVKKINLALDEYDDKKAQDIGFDVEECKIHIDRVWQFLKKWLSQQSNVSNWISFISKGTTIIVKSNIGEKKFSTQDRTGRFIKVFAKNPHETITDKLLWKKIEQLSVEEELDGQQKDQLNNTYKSVNKELKKIGLVSALQRTTPESNVIQKLWLNPSLQVK